MARPIDETDGGNEGRRASPDVLGRNVGRGTDCPADIGRGGARATGDWPSAGEAEPGTGRRPSSLLLCDSETPALPRTAPGVALRERAESRRRLPAPPRLLRERRRLVWWARGDCSDADDPRDGNPRVRVGWEEEEELDMPKRGEADCVLRIERRAIPDIV